jgi:hypothetical protein
MNLERSIELSFEGSIEHGRAYRERSQVKAFVAIGALTTVIGCAPARPELHANPARASAQPAASVAPPSCTLPSVTALAPALAKRRDEALARLLAHDGEAAKSALEDVLTAEPRNVAAYALYEATRIDVAKSAEDRATRFNRAKAIDVEDLPPKHVVRSEIDLPKEPAALHLTKISERDITDAQEASWWTAHGIDKPGTLSDTAQERFRMIGEARWAAGFHFADHEIDRYGESLLNVERKASDAPHVFDFSHAITSEGPKPFQRFGILFAEVVGPALVVEIANENDVGPQPNRYLMAIDVASGELRWASGPDTASANSFVVAGRFAITATSSVADGGMIRVVDLGSGSVLESSPVSFYPDYVVEKEGRILVLGHGSEAAFSVSPALPPAPPASFAFGEDGEATAPVAASDDPCHLARAMVALDARDGASAVAETEALVDRKTLPAIALRSAADFLVRAKEEPGKVIDLTASEIVTVAKSAEGPFSRRPARALGPPPKLVKKETIKTTSFASPLADDIEGAPSPFWRNGPPFPVPMYFGKDKLLASRVAGADVISTYEGGRVSWIHDKVVRSVLDLGAALANPEGPSTITDVATSGGFVVVAIAKASANADLGDLIAVDAATGEIVWRSARRVTIAHFDTAGDYVCATRGAPKQKAELDLLRSDTGEIVATAPLASLPTDIAVQGNRIFVQRTELVDVFALE